MDVPREELPTLEPHNCNLTFPIYPLALSNISSYLEFSMECRTFLFQKDSARVQSSGSSFMLIWWVLVSSTRNEAVVASNSIKDELGHKNPIP